MLAAYLSVDYVAFHSGLLEPVPVRSLKSEMSRIFQRPPWDTLEVSLMHKVKSAFLGTVRPLINRIRAALFVMERVWVNWVFKSTNQEKP